MGELGSAAGGRREGVPVIAAAAIAAGADGVFLEFHPDPDKARCDGPSCLPLASARDLLAKLTALRAVVAGAASHTRNGLAPASPTAVLPVLDPAGVHPSPSPTTGRATGRERV